MAWDLTRDVSLIVLSVLPPPLLYSYWDFHGCLLAIALLSFVQAIACLPLRSRSPELCYSAWMLPAGHYSLFMGSMLAFLHEVAPQAPIFVYIIVFMILDIMFAALIIPTCNDYEQLGVLGAARIKWAELIVMSEISIKRPSPDPGRDADDNAELGLSAPPPSYRPDSHDDFKQVA